MLEQLLTQSHLLKDVAIYSFSQLARGGSLYFAAKRTGLEYVMNTKIKKDMSEREIKSVVFNHSLKYFAGGLAFGAVFFGIDYYFGTEKNVFNGHNMFFYSYSLINCITSAFNFIAGIKHGKSSEQDNASQTINLEAQKLEQSIDLELLRSLDNYDARSDDEDRLITAVKRFRDADRKGDITNKDILKLYGAANNKSIVRSNYLSNNVLYSLLEQYLLVQNLIK